MSDHPLDTRMIECLAAVQRLLESFPNRGVVIGGIAVGLLGAPRATRDIDAVVMMDLEEIPGLLEAAAEFDLQPRIADPAELARRSRVVLLRHEPTGIPVDVSLGALPFESEMIERRLCYQAEGLAIPIATPEDLIIMKAISHRPQDMADIRAVAETNPSLDLARIETNVRAFAEVLEMPELWDDIVPLLRDDS